MGPVLIDTSKAVEARLICFLLPNQLLGWSGPEQSSQFTTIAQGRIHYHRHRVILADVAKRPHDSLSKALLLLNLLLLDHKVDPNLETEVKEVPIAECLETLNILTTMDDEAGAQYCTCVVSSCYGYVNHGFQSKLHPLFDIHEGLRRDDGARGNTFFHSGLRRLVEAKGALHLLCLHFGDLGL